jgi:hypothetical protein
VQGTGRVTRRAAERVRWADWDDDLNES